MNRKDLQYIRETAQKFLIELPRNARLKGDNRDLNETERLVISWVYAVNSSPKKEAELDFHDPDSCWEPG